MATFSFNVTSANNAGAILVDSNILINLGKSGQLSLLDRTNRVVVITQEVYRETVLAKPSAPEVSYIKSWLQRPNAQHVIVLENASTTVVGRGAGDDAIRNQAAHLGGAGVNVIVTSNDFDVGKILPGAIEPTFTQNTLVNSLLVGGAISSAEYYEYVNRSKDISVSDKDNIFIENILYDLKHLGQVAGYAEFSRQNGTKIEFRGQVGTADAQNRIGITANGQITYNRSIQGPECFLAGTPVLMADGTEKFIEQVIPGDVVLAFDGSADEGRGALLPRRVVRTFVNQSRQIIDLHGLHCTPGHIFLTEDRSSSQKGGFDTIAHILLTDGIIINTNGLKIRARTGAVVNSQYDQPIRVAYKFEDTNTEHFALVRCGIPVPYIDDTGKIATKPLFEYLKLNNVELLNDGRITSPDGIVYDAVDWPAGTTPFSSRETQNWVVCAKETQKYTPPWIEALEDTAEHIA